jgi:hypothetical protein
MSNQTTLCMIVFVSEWLKQDELNIGNTSIHTAIVNLHVYLLYILQIDHSLSGFATVRPNTQSSHKMVFVINGSLKMGVGKVGAQVGHAAIGLYRELQELKGRIAPMLEQWSEDGYELERTLVLD